MGTRSLSAKDLLQRRCERLVVGEMTRLAQRVPALSSAHLGHVHVALVRVIEDLVLSRAHAASDEELALLFDLTDVPS